MFRPQFLTLEIFNRKPIMPNMLPYSRFALVLATSITLAACGGGGDGDEGGSAPVPLPIPTDVVSVDGTLVNTYPQPTYAPDLTQVAYVRLNQLRLQSGAGAVHQKAELDVAATAHATYMGTYLTLSHDEDPANAPLFYGATPSDRAAKAGYGGIVSEVFGGARAADGAEDGNVCVENLLNTVYQAQALLGSWTDIGVAKFVDGTGSPACILNPGQTSAYGQIPPTGSFVAYPFDGATVDGNYWIGNEVPRPSVSLFPGQVAGHPISVSIRNADYINLGIKGTLAVKLNEFTLKDGSGNLVAGHILAGSDVAAASGVIVNSDSLLSPGTITFVPRFLLPAGVYTVAFRADLGAGKPELTKTTWSFTVR